MIKNKLGYFTVPILMILILISVFQVGAETNVVYMPTIGDTFSYSGSMSQIESHLNERLITNTTTGELIDYEYSNLEKNANDLLQNISLDINGVWDTYMRTNLSLSGIKNYNGSYQRNETNKFDPDTRNWQNNSLTENYNQDPYTESQSMEFNYTDSSVPSTMIVGDSGTIVYVGIPEIPMGSDSGDSGSSCSQQDMINFTINNGEILLPDIYPFNDMTAYTLAGIFDINVFDFNEFNNDNKAYVDSHGSDNITWSQIAVDLISGIDHGYDGLQVILVYHLTDHQFGQYEAQENYCSNSGNGGGSPFEYFGDFSLIKLTWNDVVKTNEQYTINGYQLSLTTISHQGLNQTNRQFTRVIPIGDPGHTFDAPVELKLSLDVALIFEYDKVTGFLVNFSTKMTVNIELHAQNIEVPLGDSGYNGTGNINSSIYFSNVMEFKLASHSGLYQEPQSTSSTTIDSTESTSKQNTVTITTDFPTYVFFLALATIIITKRKIH